MAGGCYPSHERAEEEAGPMTCGLMDTCQTWRESIWTCGDCADHTKLVHRYKPRKGASMKKVFISHPFRSNPVVNRRKIADICREIAETQPDVMPVSPVHAFSYLDDAIHRQLAIGYCLELLELCDELWMYNDWRESEGCMKEYTHAWRKGMVILESTAGNSNLADAPTRESISP